MKYDCVFVVLVYRNTNDLLNFFSCQTIPNSKVIVVNSYFDEKSEKSFSEIALKYNADFISVPNKGYGAGNNRGIEYALSHYDFEYLIVSNADICIKQMDISTLYKYPVGIYAPSIVTLTGKPQNPHMPYRFSIIDKYKYCFYKCKSWNAIIAFCGLNKIFRYIFYLSNKIFGCNKIYTAHGAFVIIPKNILELMLPLYDENVFLFTEEENLGMNALTRQISTYYVPQIKILHKEDGSVSSISEQQNSITRDSFMTFYEKWYLNSNEND